MLKTVFLAADSLDPTSWEKHEVDNVADFLMTIYPEGLPHSARIYYQTISEATDITPYDDASVQVLLELEGEFYVVIYPEITLPFWLIWVAVGLQVAFTIYMYSKIPNSSQRNLQQSSPNNTVSNRTNNARLAARIPAIYGTVQSTPDLLSTYIVYENNVQVEYSYLCIGEGYYEIDPLKIYDGTTPFQNVNGNSLDIYNPYTRPNNGTPFLSLGGGVSEPLKTVIRDNAVNGQTLLASNQGSYVGTGTMGYSTLTNGDGVISYMGLPSGSTTTPSQPPVFRNLFTVGGQLQLSNSPLDGVYTIVAVTDLSITVAHPVTVNPAWTSSISIEYNNGTVATYGYAWIGSFTIKGGEEVWCNLAAINGMFADNGENQFQTNVEIMVGITPLNSSGTPIGSEVITNTIIYGSAVNRDPIAKTFKLSPPIKGAYYKVRAARYNPKNTSFKGQIIDDVKWQDVYSVSPVTQSDFGNVTTIRARTQATVQSTALKERKLNLIVTRKLPTRIAGTNTFTTTLYPTNNAADIICAIALDKTFGNRTVSEIDLDNIYGTVGVGGEVSQYFGSNQCAEFCYTFDNSNVTFEEAFGMIAGATFCTAYRRGSKLKLYFEKKTTDATLLFNHRNKIPKTEQRTIRFGNEKNYDSLQYQWVSPTTVDSTQGKGGDSLETYYMPDEYYKPTATYSAPNKVQSIGVRNKLQAYFQSHRIWNKIKYQSVAVEFTATNEADILVPTERILIADNTRADTQDGEVNYQTGLILGLSQPVKWVTSTMVIFLQLYDGSVESMTVSQSSGLTEYEVLLSRAPRLPLVLDDDAFANTTYMLVPNTDSKSKAFLVTERASNGDLTTKISAVNYDDRFYGNDKDYINGIVDINGNLI